MKAEIKYNPIEFPRYWWTLSAVAEGEPDWLEMTIASGMAFTEAGATRAVLRAWRKALRRRGYKKEVPLK